MTDAALPFPAGPRPDWRAALRRSFALRRLAGFDPHVAGTPPLRLATPASDLDLLCHAPDPAAFARHLWREFGAERGFALWQWRGAPRPVLARFRAEGWEFEIFGAAQPVAEQAGWRHFVVERRLLALGGTKLRRAVRAARQRGMKTEPAFASVLGLEGDPYAALLALWGAPPARLRALLAQALHAAPDRAPGSR
ncbi:DUF4269 domain-containing protein [Pseudoroseomonas cervicalis]|uniref:DUF4269 domain-containing protein n=1 Tax=Teichococcus cervicalis TaxID=204525 RepID=UPI002782DB81|nr:DUF4269 domain-containing protein [Pseudoroseomonas cervicalis]MDQ1081069.1 hypothetical protein [Pseudoroseomonas cervicalis]